jgi:ribulose-phosphate 3-epimerase
LSNPVHIAPSILAADMTRLGAQLQAVEQGGADRIHFDVMDGRFVPNITMGPFILEAVRRATTLPVDVHLMIDEPDHLLPAFADAGASSISVHVETCPNLHRTLQSIAALGCKVGVAINPHTPAFVLGEVVHLLDLILVMTVNPGFGGQAFLPETLPKIAQLRKMCDASGRAIDIAVDGGINVETAGAVYAHGANVLIAGSAIFNADDGAGAEIARLRGAVAT